MPDERREPTSDRPHMPGYGLPDPTSHDGLLPWAWARERLTAARGYWIATIRPDGRPHLMTVWAVWHDDRLYFSTGRDSRKARNLTADPRVSVSTDAAADAVVVEGTAAPAGEPHDPDVVAAYTEKYGAAPPDAPDAVLYAVEPSVAFGFIDSDELFTTTATRWRF